MSVASAGRPLIDDCSRVAAKPVRSSEKATATVTAVCTMNESRDTALEITLIDRNSRTQASRPAPNAASKIQKAVLGWLLGPFTRQTNEDPAPTKKLATSSSTHQAVLGW